MQSMIMVKVEIHPGDEDSYNASLTRVSDDRMYPLMNLRGLTRAEIYTKFGIDLPRKEIPFDDANSEAERLLRKALASLGERSIISTSEATDLLLDVLNTLPTKED